MNAQVPHRLTADALCPGPQTAVYETPVKTVALTPVAPLRRLQSVGLASVGPHSACKSPAEEAALLRTVSSVMKLHMDSVQRAASLCVRVCLLRLLRWLLNVCVL